MSHITEVFADEIIKKMHYFYADQLIEPAPNGAIFRAKTDDATITAYRSKKVLFQGRNPEKEARIWQGFDASSSAPTEPNSDPTSQRPNLSSNTSVNKGMTVVQGTHIGSDESGTGDYFGPVTACAVFVHAEQIDMLRSIGIQDSKAIKDDTIKTLAGQLVDMKIPFASVVLRNEKYNTLQRSGWSQGKIKAMLHHTVLEKVREQTKVENGIVPIVIDQFCVPKVYASYLRSEGLSIPDDTHFMTKAETHSIAVAAASVIARLRFVEEMDKLSEELGQTLIKGASQKVDKQIAAIIREYGVGKLDAVAKVHFANTKKAEKWL